MTGKIDLEYDDAIAWMTINNPARHNAISAAMYQQAAELLREVAAADGIRALVLRGAGEKAFASGADISKFGEERDTVEQVMTYRAHTDEMVQALRNLPQPSIAMIQGWCIGGGLGLALNCDLRISTDEARFGNPSARLGLGYSLDSVKTLVDVVGAPMTKEILFTSRRYSAAEALRMGLLHAAVPKSVLVPFTRSYVQQITANAPMSVRTMKFTINEVLKDAAERRVDICDADFIKCFESNDYKEGRAAFMEKREPQFTGT